MLNLDTGWDHMTKILKTWVIRFAKYYFVSIKNLTMYTTFHKQKNIRYDLQINITIECFVFQFSLTNDR